MNRQARLNGSKTKRYPAPYTLFSPDQRAIRTWDDEKVIGVDPLNTWDYYINPYGFRWTLQEKPKVLFNGCSHTFGQGVVQEETFGEIICREYLEDKYECMNLGLPGTGPEIQNINLNWALNTFDDIQAVVWYMSTPARKIMVQHEQIHTFHPGTYDWFNNKKFAKSYDKIQVNLWERTKLNTYWMLYNTFSRIKDRGIKLMFRCWDGECHVEFKKLKQSFDFKHFDNLPKLDRARDWDHMGPKSHRRMAEGIWKAWNES